MDSRNVRHQRPGIGLDDAAGLPAFAVNIVLHCAIYLLIPVYQIYSHKALAYVISIGQPLLPMLCFGSCRGWWLMEIPE